jgi:outer membrane protein
MTKAIVRSQPVKRPADHTRVPLFVALKFSRPEFAAFPRMEPLLYCRPLWRRLAVVGLLLTLAGRLAAGDSPAAGDAPWTLERALDRAMEENADLNAAKREFERQEGIRLQVRARLLPNVSASASANERARGLVDLSPAQRSLPPSPDTAVALFGYDLRLEVRQLVFDGLSSLNQSRRQQLVSKQAYLNLHNTALRTATSVRQSFDAIQLRAAARDAERRRVEEFVQLVEWTARRRTVGEIPEFELLRAQAELQGARADLAEAGRALVQAEQSFRRLLQLSDEEGRLQLAGSLVPRPFDLPLADAVAQARRNRPDLEGAAVAVEAARRNERALTGRYLPRVEAFASYGTRTSYYNSATRLDGWTVGAAGQWSLFEGGAMKGQRMTTRAELRAAEARLADTQHQIVSRLRELFQGLEQARVTMEAQKESVSLAARASRDARRLFEVGQANLEQVLQSGMTHRRAESRFGEAIYNFNALIAEIEYSVGGRLSDSLHMPEQWKR